MPDNIDAIQPICGVPLSETKVQVRDQMRGYGGTGGNPAQVTCPSESTAASPTPVVLGLDLMAEGIHGKVLNSIDLLRTFRRGGRLAWIDLRCTPNGFYCWADTRQAQASGGRHGR
jgi:hypothetical protein